MIPQQLPRPEEVFLIAQPSHRRGVSASFFSSRRALQAVARCVLVAWLCPLLMSLLAVMSVRPAQAQIAQNPAEPTVVLDFSVPAGVDAVVGRKAADALAVELSNSGNYQVKSRQDVETAITQNPGLTPPFNTTTQANLARAVAASSVFSGRVVGVRQDGRSARVQIEVRQLEAATEDYINGTLISEVSEVKLQNTPSEVLVDEALNKAAGSAVRSLGQTQLPRGVVLNVTANDVELSIGTRNGVAVGQRYSVLRDVFNRARNFTERTKIGEVRVARTEADQSTAVLSAGGGGGVTTGDRVRRIYELTNIPVSAGAGAGSTSITPVTAPPQTSNRGGIVKRSKKGFLGIVGLAAAVAIFGFGGGGSNSNGGNSSPRSVDPYRGIPGDPSDGYRNNANDATGFVQVAFTSGASGFSTDARNIAGYFIYRGSTSAFSPDAGSLQGFVVGNTRQFTDDATTTVGRGVTIGTLGSTVTNGNTFVISRDVREAIVADTAPTSGNMVNTDFTQEPPASGVQYFYAVQRVTVIENRDASNGPNSGVLTRTLQLSNLSRFSGGVTAIAGPRVQPAPLTSANVNNFVVAVRASTVSAFQTPGATPLPTATPIVAATPLPTATPSFQAPLYAQVTQFEVQVSINPSFPRTSRFQQRFGRPPATNTAGNFVFSLGNPAGTSIVVPDFQAGSQQQLYVRVGARNTSDQPGERTPFVFGPAQSFTPTGSAIPAPASRFFGEESTRGNNGIGLQGVGGGAGRFSSGHGGRRSPRILTPR